MWFLVVPHKTIKAYSQQTSVTGEKMIRYKIDARLPSLNDLINATRSNKYKGASLKKETDLICKTFAANHRRSLTAQFQEPAILHFEWHESNKRRDYDNVFSAKKYILDSLQQLGVLDNDSPRYIRGLYDTMIYDDKDYVVVSVMGLSEKIELIKLLKL